MAPVAMILGGISGTFSAMMAWLLLGLSFWAAVQVYFLVGLGVAALLIVVAWMRPRAHKAAEPQALQQA